MSADPSLTYDVIVAGAGIGGVCAAVAAAREGARVLLVERRESIGGTGVHSPVTLICTFFDASGRYINRGIHEELFPHIYRLPIEEVMSYDEAELARRYREVVAAEPRLSVITGSEIASVRSARGRIHSVTTRGAHPGEWRASVFVDATADGNLSALAGAEYRLGREGDGALQPATLTFRVAGFDPHAFPFPLPRGRVSTWPEFARVCEDLKTVYVAQKAAGRITSSRAGVLLIPYPDSPDVAFNQTQIVGVDPTDPASVARGLAEGRRQVDEFMEAMRAHPAMRRARVVSISPMLGVREGRRILGDYVLTGEDCLGEARFDDMVAACGYAIDIHDPAGGGSRLVRIPGSGYYHIPYRCLTARGFSNLLTGSRCISGTHEAHSSYRVMPPIAAIGQAAGTAAALAAARAQPEVRAVSAAAIRRRLAAAGQFVEEPVPAAEVA
jgi:hypothetical protein